MPKVLVTRISTYLVDMDPDETEQDIKEAILEEDISQETDDFQFEVLETLHGV